MGFSGTIQWAALEVGVDLDIWHKVVTEFGIKKIEFGFAFERDKQTRKFLQEKSTSLSVDEQAEFYDELGSRAYEQGFESGTLESLTPFISPSYLVTCKCAFDDPELNKFRDYLKAHIPPDILDVAGMDAVYMSIGPDFAWSGENSESEVTDTADSRPTYFYTTFQFSLHGPGSPLHWPECRKQILALPRVKSITERLERIVGKCRIDVGWS